MRQEEPTDPGVLRQLRAHARGQMRIMLRHIGVFFKVGCLDNERVRAANNINEPTRLAAVANDDQPRPRDFVA